MLADPHESVTRSHSRLDSLLLASIIVVGVVARFWGLLYGLPHAYYPDESSLVGDAHRMAVTGDLRPTQFLWPTLWIYAVAVGVKAGLALSVFPGGAGPLGDASLSNSTYVYGVARTMTAIAGVLTIPVVYAVAARLCVLLAISRRRWLALFPSGFLALSPLHVQHSHVTSPDVPTTLFLALAMYAALRIMDTGTPRWYLLAGLTLGISTGIKYPGALFSIAIVAAHLARAGVRWRRPGGIAIALFDWRLWLAGSAAGCVFFGTSPYILLDWHRFLYDFREQAERVLTTGPAGTVGLSGPYAHLLYVPRTMAWGLDTPVALLALAGLAVCCWLAARHHARSTLVRWALVTFLVFPLVQAYFALSWQMRFARYLLALIPFGCLLAGLGLVGLWLLVARRSRVRTASMAVVSVGVAAMLWQAHGVIRYDLFLTRQDTRTIAARWLEEHMPPGELLLVEWYGPPYPHVRQAGFNLSDRPLDRYLGRTPRFIAVSSFTYDRWLRTPDRFPRRAAFYQGLQERGTLLYEVRPHPNLDYDPVQEGWDGWHLLPLTDDARPGPIIRIYQVAP